MANPLTSVVEAQLRETFSSVVGPYATEEVWLSVILHGVTTFKRRIDHRWMTFRSLAYDVDAVDTLESLRLCLDSRSLPLERVSNSKVLDLLACTELLHVDPRTMSCCIAGPYARRRIRSFVDMHSDESSVFRRISKRILGF